MWAQRPIVEKHHRYAFYHPFTEGVASMICDLLNKFATSVMFHITLYFMTNLRRSAGAFFTYYLFNFFIVLTMSMVFRTLGSLSRTLEQTMAPASIMVLLSIAYTGFVIPVPYMKPWLSWFRRVNPIAYTYESLMINEVGFCFQFAFFRSCISRTNQLATAVPRPGFPLLFDDSSWSRLQFDRYGRKSLLCYRCRSRRGGYPGHCILGLEVQLHAGSFMAVRWILPE